MDSLLKDPNLITHDAPVDYVFSERLLTIVDETDSVLKVLGLIFAVVWGIFGGYELLQSVSYHYNYDYVPPVSLPAYLLVALVVALLLIGSSFLASKARNKRYYLYKQVLQGKLVKVTRKDDGTATYEWKLVVRGKNRMGGLRTQTKWDETEKSEGEVYVINGYADFRMTPVE